MFHYIITLRAAEKAVDGKAAGKRAMTSTQLASTQGNMLSPPTPTPQKWKKKLNKLGTHSHIFIYKVKMNTMIPQ